MYRGKFLIRHHEFNSSWWGKPVGIVSLEKIEPKQMQSLHEVLSLYDWVEYKQNLVDGISNLCISRLGFELVDVQIPFRISLSNIASTPSIENMQIIPASERSFAIERDEFIPFHNERFKFIIESNEALLNKRIYLWSNQLIEANPQHCVRLELLGETMGWFLGQVTDQGLQLTLAMLKRGSNISGMHLYQKAMNYYKLLGFKIGYASFSVTNTPVMNIYAKLGARFYDPIGCWIWQKLRAKPL